jgi:hypothetical protein
MAKLPDLDALGNGPSLSGKSGRGMVSADAFNLDAMPKAVQKVAAQVGKVAEEYEKDQDALDVIRADAEAKTGFMRLEQEIESDTTGHANYDSNWQAGSKGVLESAASKIRNPQLKERFQLQGTVHAESARQRLLDKGRTLAKNDAVATIEGTTRQHHGVFTDPNAPEHLRVQSQADARAGIKLGLDTGVLTRAQAQQLEDRYIRGGAGDRANAALAANPEQLTKDLEAERLARQQQFQSTAGKGASADGIFSAPGLAITNGIDPAAPYMSPKRQRDEGAIKRIIMHGDVNEDGGRLLQYGRKVDPVRGFDPGYHFYVNRDGTVVQGAPLNRTANHALNENADSIGIVIAGADAGKMPTAEQEAAAKRLVSSLGRTYNIDPKNVIGHGELQPGRRDHREGGNVAADIRTKGYLPEEESKLAGRSLTRVAGLHPATDVPPASARPYADLTPEQLEVMYDRASRATGIKNEGKRVELEGWMKSDLLQIEQDGKGYDFDEAREKELQKHFHGDQVQRWKAAREEKKAVYNAGYGLDEMSEAQMGQLLQHLDMDQENDATEKKALKAKVFDEISKRANKIMEAREKDPAASVDSLPRVKSAREAYMNAKGDEGDGMDLRGMASETEQNERVIEARLAEQRRLGVADPKPITKREARALVDFPSLATMGATKGGTKKYIEKLRGLADRIEQQYGPRYAREVFATVRDYELKQEGEKEQAVGILEKMAFGEPITPRDLRRAERLSEIDTMGRPFGTPPAPARFGVPPIAEKAGLKPVPEDVDWLKAKPDVRWEEFDKQYGTGATAKVMKELREGQQ